jgi:hypothetical protein
MKRTKSVGALLAAGILAACSSSSDSTPAAPYTGFERPVDPITGKPLIAVSFKVDDTANKVYGPGDLKWKGGMVYNTTTRKLTRDTSWSGPWAPLYDDGPWTVTTTSHEPSTATAGDHIWGVTVFVTPPATGSDTYEYGLIDSYYQDGWIWVGGNGTFTVAANATADIVAPGMVIPAFGDRDIKLVLDSAALDPDFTYSLTNVRVKGSAWAWVPVDITSSASAGVYTFKLSDYIGATHPLKHTGKLVAGAQPEFIFVFDGMMTGSATTSCCDNASVCGNPHGYPCEYKAVAGNTALATGITASYAIGTDPTFTTTAIGWKTGGFGAQNTFFAVP